tara:strand:+ start:261 stop:584 length:324 start_codon:yes stop_codon:yes gene_type:complete
MSYPMEPSIVDYYRDYPLNVDVIKKMNEEHHLLMDENEKLKKELEFVKRIFKYPLRNNVIFNLVRLKKNGEDVWINKIQVSENELKELDDCEEVRYLLKICNPRCER